MAFTHLLSPMKVGNKVYKNRIVSAPMAFSLVAQNPMAAEVSYRKLEGPAKGGNACVILGETDVNFRDAVRIPGFKPFDFAKPEEDMATFKAVKTYADRIKKHDCIALAELVHCGKEKVPFNDQQEAIGPVDCVNSAGVPVRAMTKDDMDRIANDFAVAAVYMQKAGFDGILVHGGHGFIFTQYLSPLMNTRTDEYGGSLENRAKFPIQICKAIREAVGPDFLFELRIDGTDHQPGGITPEETGEFIRMVEQYITSVHVTCGIYEESVKSGTESSMFHEHGLNIGPASIIKKYTSLPVGAVGGINSPEQAEEAIAAGKIDMVSMGRQFFADPAFPNKAKEGHADEIRRCLRCGRCYPGPSGEHETEIWTVKFPPLDSCTINPYDVWPASHHKVLPDRMPKPEASRKVLVVGGGCGGLQTAITAADRGHQVILCEKSGVLGGLINFTDHTDHKVDIRNFKDLLIRDVEKRPIEVRLNCEVTPELIKEIAPEAVVLAVGSDDLILPIEGIENAVTAMDVYYNDFAGLGKSTIVLGGGLVGCEAAADYIDHGVETTIVEMKGALMPETTGLYRTAVHDFIDKNGGKYEVNAKVTKVGKDFVVAEQDGKEITIKADSVVNAMGRRAHATEALETAIKEAGIPVWKIGDCVRARQIGDAVREGWTAAMEII